MVLISCILEDPPIKIISDIKSFLSLILEIFIKSFNIFLNFVNKVLQTSENSFFELVLLIS